MLDVLSDLDNHYAEAWTQDEANVTYGKSNPVFSTQDNKLKRIEIFWPFEPLVKPLLSADYPKALSKLLQLLKLTNRSSKLIGFNCQQTMFTTVGEGYQDHLANFIQLGQVS